MKFRFAAIFFAQRSDALSAIKNLNGMIWNGRKLLIDFSYKHSNLQKQFKIQNKPTIQTHHDSTRDSHSQENSFSSSSKKTKLNVDC